MKLSEYMEAESLTPADVAQKIGVQSVATIYRYTAGTRRPSSKMLRRIHEFTNGAVTANDFFHAPDPTQRSAS